MLFDEKKPVGGTFLDLERAKKWDDRSTKLESNHLEKVKDITSKLMLTPESIVADLGCGTGFFTIELARYCKKVFAIDISPIMLELLNEKILINGISNIVFNNKGILEYLSEHENNDLDALILQVSFHHLPDFWKSVAVYHMARILKPNGKVFLSDVIFTFPVSDYKECFKEMIDFIRLKGDEGLTKDAENHLLEEYSTFDWIIEGMFQRNGFKMISKDKKSSTYSDYIFQKY